MEISGNIAERMMILTSESNFPSIRWFSGIWNQLSLLAHRLFL